MTAKYTLRMQFGPHEDTEQIRDEVLSLCRAGQADEVMFFAFAEEQNDGHDSLERLRAWMEAIRPWKKALEAQGIEVSLNPWHSLLHCDRGRRFKPGQPWQPMVDWRGREAAAVVCPLDPGWRAYYTEAMRIFAAERFRVVWVDDDIRYHNHEPLDWGGCWCPLHIAEFSSRAGVETTREEVVANLIRPGEPHPWRAMWLDMWDDLHRAMLSEWRDIVEAEGCALGLMSSVMESHSMEGRRWAEWWPAMASRTRSVHRPHFWGYSDGGPEALAQGIGQLQLARLVEPGDVESDPEIENFPYGPWNKSFRQTAAQLSLAQVFGADRLAVSVYDFMGNLPSDEPERPAFLARMKPLLSWLGDQFGSGSPRPRALQPVGVGVPWRDDYSRTVHCGRHDWRALEVSTRGWDQWLAGFGFAFSKTCSETVNALAGGMAWAFSEDELRDLLSRGLLLDGPAATILCERGFGDHIGLANARFITQDEVLYSIEESLDAEFGLRPRAQMSVNAGKPYKDSLLQGTPVPDARVISVLRDPLQLEVGHGCFVYENALGGRVGVAPWDVTAGANFATARRAQLRAMLEWLATDTPVAAVEGGAWLVSALFSDGTEWRGAAWNGSPDFVREFRVTPPAGGDALERATFCSAEGDRAEASVSGDLVVLPRPMAQWDWVVLNPAP